jgi:adenosylhomocysteinase
MHTTNLLVTGKNVVVAVTAGAAEGLRCAPARCGAMVYVTEIDPVKAIERQWTVPRSYHGRGRADRRLFRDVTGCDKVITPGNFEVMRDGAVLCNAGHFDVEIDKAELKALSCDIYVRRENISGLQDEGRRTLNLLAEGRLVNLAAGNGHPAEIMDMSFSPAGALS